MLPQRRRLFRWRMSFNLLMLLGLICGCELASVNVPQSSTSSGNKKSPNIGTFSNFEWQAWLLVDTQSGSHSIDMDSATILRRITPKSVFVAPEHKNASKCSEGYYADQRGRCVKSVSVDEDAYRDFLLKKLNAQFGLAPVGKNQSSQSSGPLQLNIPLTSPDVDVKPHHSTKTEKFELTETRAENDRIVFPPRSVIRLDGERRGQTQAETASEAKSDAALFFRPNFSNGDADKADQKPDVIPLTLLVRESDASSSKPEDYKVPLDMKTMLNILSVKGLTESNVTAEDVPAEKQNSTQAPPTLVLLLTPTNLPNSDEPSLAQNGTANYAVTARSNFTSNTVAKETSDVSVASSSTDLPSTQTEPTEVAPIVVDKHRDNETHSEDELKAESPKLNESQEIEVIYDYDDGYEDFDYVTNEPDEDEEILKHGEAGITIPTRSADRAQQNRTANRNETLDARDRVVIRFNDTTSTDDGDDADSNVSSQVSIDGDRILETTLLDVSTERLLTTTTELPEVIQQNVKNTDDSGKSTDRRLSSESGVPPSHRNMHAVVSGNDERERVANVEAERSEELEAAPTSSESLLYDPSEGNPITQTSEEKSKRKMVQENPRNTKSDIPLVNLGRTTMTLDSAEDYVEFPDNARRQDGYIRFPSNEANSVHSPTYEQPYPADDRSSYGDTSTESSVPVHRKPVYYPTRSSWKPDRPQRDHVPASARRRPPLLSFWSRMPLIRDPAVYPVDQVPSDEAADAQMQHRPLRTSASRRRGSYNTEISSENMTLVQK